MQQSIEDSRAATSVRVDAVASVASVGSWQAAGAWSLVLDEGYVTLTTDGALLAEQAQRGERRFERRVGELDWTVMAETSDAVVFADWNVLAPDAAIDVLNVLAQAESVEAGADASSFLVTTGPVDESDCRLASNDECVTVAPVEVTIGADGRVESARLVAFLPFAELDADGEAQLVKLVDYQVTFSDWGTTVELPADLPS